MVDIGENISALRMGKGLSRAAFADALGTNQDKIKNIETGRQRVDHEILAMLRKVYSVDLNDLVGGQPAQGQILPDTLPQQAEFIPMPRYAIEASAGHGSAVYSEEATGYYAYSRAFLERRGLKPEHLAVISVRGQSMEPDLRDGDLTLINRADAQRDTVEDGKIYAVIYGGELFVKRLQLAPNNRLMLASSNPSYPPIPVEAGELDTVKIIGRVITSTHEW